MIISKKIPNTKWTLVLSPIAGFSVEVLSDGPELLIGGSTSAWKAEARPEGVSYLGGSGKF